MKQSQDNTIRVAYDATVLAAARQNPHARTGIFRVAENVARQLLDHPDVELSWTAYGNPGLLGILDELVQEDRSLQAPILAPLRTNRLLSILKKPLDVLTATSLSRLVEPSRRTIEGWQNKAACAVRNFQQVDILHSPYHAFPPRENRSQHPVRFLTVHDLIPIKHPEWFCEWSATEIRTRVVPDRCRRLGAVYLRAYAQRPSRDDAQTQRAERSGHTVGPPVQSFARVLTQDASIKFVNGTTSDVITGIF